MSRCLWSLHSSGRADGPEPLSHLPTERTVERSLGLDCPLGSRHASTARPRTGSGLPTPPRYGNPSCARSRLSSLVHHIRDMIHRLGRTHGFRRARARWPAGYHAPKRSPSLGECVSLRTRYRCKEHYCTGSNHRPPKTHTCCSDPGTCTLITGPLRTAALTDRTSHLPTARTVEPLACLRASPVRWGWLARSASRTRRYAPALRLFLYLTQSHPRGFAICASLCVHQQRIWVTPHASKYAAETPRAHGRASSPSITYAPARPYLGYAARWTPIYLACVHQRCRWSSPSGLRTHVTSLRRAPAPASRHTHIISRLARWPFGPFPPKMSSSLCACKLEHIILHVSLCSRRMPVA